MWTKSFSIVTNKVTGEQMWKLFADVNSWYMWDAGIEYAQMEGRFEAGNHFYLKPKGGPKVKIKLVEAVPGRKFTDFTKFPLGKMYGEHTFEPVPEGLKITTKMTVSGLLGFLWRKLVAQQIVDGLPVEMEEQIKAAAKL